MRRRGPLNLHGKKRKENDVTRGDGCRCEQSGEGGHEREDQ